MRYSFDVWHPGYGEQMPGYTFLLSIWEHFTGPAMCTRDRVGIASFCTIWGCFLRRILTQFQAQPRTAVASPKQTHNAARHNNDTVSRATKKWQSKITCGGRGLRRWRSWLRRLRGRLRATSAILFLGQFCIPNNASCSHQLAKILISYTISSAYTFDTFIDAPWRA